MTPFELLPIGEYVCKVEEASVGVSVSGRIHIKLKLQIELPERYRAYYVFDRRNFPVEEELCLSPVVKRMREMLDACELNDISVQKLVTAASTSLEHAYIRNVCRKLTGRQASVRIRHDMIEGRVYPRVSRIWSLADRYIALVRQWDAEAQEQSAEPTSDGDLVDSRRFRNVEWSL